MTQLLEKRCPTLRCSGQSYKVPIRVCYLAWINTTEGTQQTFPCVALGQHVTPALGCMMSLQPAWRQAESILAPLSGAWHISLKLVTEKYQQKEHHLSKRLVFITCLSMPSQQKACPAFILVCIYEELFGVCKRFVTFNSSCRHLH